MGHSSSAQASLGTAGKPGAVCWLLMCGTDPTLLATRGKILESAGYRMDIISNVDDAQRLLTMGGREYALVVLCHTVPSSSRAALAELARNALLPVFQIERLMDPPNLLRAVSAHRKSCD